MRKLLLFLAPAFTFMASCQKGKDASTPTSQLKTDSTYLNLSGNKNSLDSFTVQYSSSWSITVNPSTATWLKTSVASGTGNTKVYVSIEQENTSGAARTASIIVTPNGDATKSLSLTVTQKVFTPLSSILWSRVLGGSGDEIFPAIIKTIDGGYITVGASTSKDGDVSSNKGKNDIWVVKMDAGGNKVWEKSYGGSSFELGAAIAQSQDGGFFIEAQTNSNDGDVTGIHIDPSFPALIQPDIWVLKIDANGNLLWEKSLGGSGVDYFTTRSIVGTADGGCVLGAGAASNDGDVSGNHGDMDVWAVKLNSNGDILWQTALGGTAFDEGYSITPAPDGGYVIAGITYSIDGDVSGMHTISNATDAWIVKIDENGKKVWQKALGGSANDVASAIITTADGGYMVAGSTNSIDGDVSGFHGGTGKDVWVVKMDGTGNIAWQKTLGGTANDEAYGITATSDGYVIVGYTTSTDGDVTGNHGGMDAWVLKMDANGNKLWQKAFGGTVDDYGGTILSTTDGNYIFSGNTASNDGEVSGNHGKTDGWVVKFKAE